MKEFGHNFGEILDKYSDADLDRMVQEKGFGGTFTKIMEDAAINKVKSELKEMGHKVLSDKVEDFFDEERAKFMVMNNGATFQAMGSDDRLGENMDNALIHFEFKGKIVLPQAKNEKAERFVSQMKMIENKIVGEFLMRTPPEYLKLLIYYAKVRSFDDLKKIFNKFNEKKDEINQYTLRSRGGSLSVIDRHPVEFISALPGKTLESVFKRTNLKSIDDYMSLFFEIPHMTTFIGSVSSRFLDHIMDITKVQSVGDLAELAKNENFRNALINTDYSGLFTDNLITTMDYFKVKNKEGIQTLINSQQAMAVMKKANKSNLQTFICVSDIKTQTEFERLCGNTVVLENIGETDYTLLKMLFKKIGIADDQINQLMYETITNSFTRKTSEQSGKLIDLLSTKIVPKNFKDFILSIISDEDYVEQNLDSTIKLLQNNLLTTENNMKDFEELQKIMGGFITPELSKKYIQANDKQTKTEIIDSYKKMMAQTLSSSKIEITDPSLIAEIIFLAYRPTGYSIDQIKKMISGVTWNGLQDLTHHLDNLNFDRNGYVMKFNLIEREQIKDYDIEKLKQINNVISKSSQPVELKDLIPQVLSDKQKDQNALPKFFNYILQQINDDRIINYHQNYQSGKRISAEYGEQRLSSLSEIWGIIPKEDIFYQKLSEVLNSKNDLKILVQNSADKHQWKTNKKYFSEQERVCKNRIDEILKHLSLNSNAKIMSLISAQESLKDLQGLSNTELYKTLLELKTKKYLGYDSAKTNATDIFYKVLLQYAKNNNIFIKNEMKKVKLIKSNVVEEVKAVLSKNVGSYFAKAGAEICTSHNLEMWREERHIHLNLVHKDQIVGNVMLYFESERDYIVARGFNPRNDSMTKFDRYSMAVEIVGVLEKIAKANGYKEIFIPEQTGWHALSNRDGMAKEIEEISKKNIKKIEERFPNQRTVIDNTQFYVTENGGTSVEKLNLLTVVS